MTPGMEGYWQATVEDLPPALYKDIHARLSDFGESRLAAMDAAGIDRAVLSLAGPGVQAERDTATARARAREANDALAAEIARRRTATPASRTCRCRTAARPPTSWSGRCASSAWSAAW